VLLARDELVHAAELARVRVVDEREVARAANELHVVVVVDVVHSDDVVHSVWCARGRACGRGATHGRVDDHGVFVLV
jgi:hypothetical protein